MHEEPLHLIPEEWREEAAKKLGIEIPAMCYKEGYDYFTSCMMCVESTTEWPPDRRLRM